MSLLVKETSDAWLLVEAGQCIAVSRPAAKWLGSATGSFNVAMEALLPPSEQAKLKAAWTRAKKRDRSRASMDGLADWGKVQMGFFRLDSELHIVTLQTEYALANDEAHPANEPESLELEDPNPFSGSHPDLPEIFSNKAILEALALRNAATASETFGILVLECISSGSNQHLWGEIDACKLILLRLNDVVRGEDTIAHLAGSRFGVVLDDVMGEADLEKLRLRLIEEMNEPFLEEIMPPHLDFAIQTQLFNPGQQRHDDIHAWMMEPLTGVRVYRHGQKTDIQDCTPSDEDNGHEKSEDVLKMAG